MKFLLILLVALVGIFLWRSNRQTEVTRQRQQSGTAAAPLAMVCCTLCSVHVPLVDAVQGNKGLYCSADHLRCAEP